jgi:hypothetical protein
MALVQWSAFPFDLRPARVAPPHAFRSRWNDEGDALVLSTFTASFDEGDLVVRVAKLPSVRPRRFAIHVAGEADAQDLAPSAGTPPAGVWERTRDWARRSMVALRRALGGAR